MYSTRVQETNESCYYLVLNDMNPVMRAVCDSSCLSLFDSIHDTRSGYLIANSSGLTEKLPKCSHALSLTVVCDPFSLQSRNSRGDILIYVSLQLRHSSEWRIDYPVRMVPKNHLKLRLFTDVESLDSINFRIFSTLRNNVVFRSLLICDMVDLLLD